ncbi:Uncharacterized protein APZ42_017355 [Daphnia magna]|uniref:Uncharacterized protein n=2 Tax=Daphnia magna TaxID=35525 RepID=A0ABR0ANJ3_9CRUS|nr:hypothetical protein OUZ56_015721 [Daphnia magna]KZS16754.1 Uncharacterized protein APZ42_017355 [Daphnia magna]
MKIIVVLFMVTLCVGPSLCVWGKLKAKLTNSSSTSPTMNRMGVERRVGKPDEDKDYEDEGAGSLELDGIESTIINGTDQEERFYNKFPLHVFMKKKRPFVSFSTVTQTSTVTALITSSTVGLCAKLVNVTGPCRLRRGLWEEDPIVLSFEDDMDSIDEALSPSKIFSIETTAMPQDVAEERSGIDANNNQNRRISVRSGAVIHSSKDDGESKDDDDGNEGRFGFFGLKKKFKKKIKFITVITTTVVTSTSTSTYYVTISTKTFFIQLCTPSPFPFNICNGRKKRQAQLEEMNRASNQNS